MAAKIGYTVIPPCVSKNNHVPLHTVENPTTSFVGKISSYTVKTHYQPVRAADVRVAAESAST